MNISALILIIGVFAILSSAKPIVPLEDPYVWRHDLLLDSQTKTSIAITFHEKGDLNVILKVGSWTDNYAKQMPILTASCSINVLSEWVFAKFGAGLNWSKFSAVVTGNTDGTAVRFLLNNWVFTSDALSVGGSIQGENLNLKKFGALLNTYGVSSKVMFDENLALSEISTNY